MGLKEIAEFFDIDNLAYVSVGVSPKSCGGGDEFKYFALVGDKFLDLVIIEKMGEKGVLNTGEITQHIARLVNAKTLSQFGSELGIPSVMTPVDPKHKIHPNEVKEAVEALLGVSYLTNGYERGYRIAIKILENLENLKSIPNYKSLVNQLLQKNGFKPVKYVTHKIRGASHNPVFVSTAIAHVNGKKYTAEGKEANKKKEAEKSAAEHLFKILSSILEVHSTS